MKKLLMLLVSLEFCYTTVHGADSMQRACKPKGPLTHMSCDSGGYYFDRGGRRMFETKYDSYQRGAFNLRRGHMWQDRACCNTTCRRMRRNCKQECDMTDSQVLHSHYSAQEGLTRWPSATDPDNGQARSSGDPVERPIWLRDIIDASGYTSPTSWQGFQ